MKAVKIILSGVVAAGIGLFVWLSWIKTDEVGDITPPRNQFVERIEQEIDSLAKSPEDVFCSEFYKNIQYRIDDYHKKGFLGGDNASDNTQWKDILSRNLYAAYALKFIEQAFYVFDDSEWNKKSLEFIASETKTLQQSVYLTDKRGPVSDKLKEISVILNKYYEISRFLADCQNYSFSYYGLSDRFPTDNMQNRMDRAHKYLSNRLDNHYVNNCRRLRDGLASVPRILFDKHVNYLNSKIRIFSDKYAEYGSHAEYKNKLYQPLREQIDSLNNDIYKVGKSFFEDSYRKVINTWDADNQRASEHKYPDDKTKENTQ